MPNSVADRLNLNYEVVYFLVRSPRYFFDLDAIREPHRSHAGSRARRSEGQGRPGPDRWPGSQDGLRRVPARWTAGPPVGKNPGIGLEDPDQGLPGPHFATFPPELIRRPILATCPEAICTRCGIPWRRRVTVTRFPSVRPRNSRSLVTSR